MYKYSQVLRRHSLPQNIYAYLNGKQFVDYIGRFENLEKDWLFVARKINVSKTLPVSMKTNHGHYRKYYNDKTRELITREYKLDIELFKYKF